MSGSCFAVPSEQEGSEMEIDPQATAALLASTPLASGPVIWPKPPTWAPPQSPHPSGANLLTFFVHSICLWQMHSSNSITTLLSKRKAHLTFTHSLAYSLTHSPTLTFSHPLVHSLIHSLTHPSHSLLHALTCSNKSYL